MNVASAQLCAEDCDLVNSTVKVLNKGRDDEVSTYPTVRTNGDGFKVPGTARSRAHTAGI